MACKIAAEVELSVLLSPEYCAVIVCTPTGMDVARKVAIPALTRTGLPGVCPLSNSSTVPFGVAAPNGVTFTVNVTGAPNPAFGLEDVRAVVVLKGPPPPPPPPHPYASPAASIINPPNSAKFRLLLAGPNTIVANPMSNNPAARLILNTVSGFLSFLATGTAAAAGEVGVRVIVVVATPVETVTLGEAKAQL